MPTESPRLLFNRLPRSSNPSRSFARRRRPSTSSGSTPTQAFILTSQPPGLPSPTEPTEPTYLPTVAHRESKLSRQKEQFRTHSSPEQESVDNQTDEPGYVVEPRCEQGETRTASAKRVRSFMAEGADVEEGADVQGSADVEFVAINKYANGTGGAVDMAIDTTRRSEMREYAQRSLDTYAEKPVQNGGGVDGIAESVGGKSTVSDDDEDDDDDYVICPRKPQRVSTEEQLAEELGCTKEQIDNMLTYVPLRAKADNKVLSRADVWEKVLSPSEEGNEESAREDVGEDKFAQEDGAEEKFAQEDVGDKNFAPAEVGSDLLAQAAVEKEVSAQAGGEKEALAQAEIDKEVLAQAEVEKDVLAQDEAGKEVFARTKLDMHSKSPAESPWILPFEAEQEGSDIQGSIGFADNVVGSKRSREASPEALAQKRTRISRARPRNDDTLATSTRLPNQEVMVHQPHPVATTDARTTDEERRTSSANAASGQERGTILRKRCFLDALPLEVCIRIAAFYGRFPDLNSLNLAMISKRFKEAVLSCVEHTLDLTNPREVPQLEQWEKLFLPSLRDIRCSDPAWPIERKLFHSPTLLHATVPYDESLLSELKMAPNLRSLCVSLDGVYSPRALITALAQLKIEHLSIRCEYCDTDACAITRLSRSRRGRRGFANFPAITSLEFFCDRKSTEGRTDLEFSNLVTALPNLHEITLRCSVPENVIQALGKLDSVKLIEVADGVKTAVKIGSSVTTLMCAAGQPFMHGDDISRLTACPNLKELALSIEPSAEFELPLVVRNLEVLHLSWRWEKVRSSPQSFKAKYYTPPTDIIWEILQSAPNVVELVLHGAPLSANQVERILSTLGPQLRRFGLTVDSERESTHLLLLSLMDGLRLNCAGLKQLDLKFNNNFRCLSGESGRVWSRKLRFALKLLVRRLPLLNVWDLENGIRRLDVSSNPSGI
eukprot:GFKZ01008515.1.p1 GENE.GFKZ01008515.1~~GFKZ01008515.1.p1  ORF type:complete len:947 (+),score=141.12 GFKZ01008515.1:62-2902(+)